MPEPAPVPAPVPNAMDADLARTVVSSEAIQRRVAELAALISRDYANVDREGGLVVVPVMTGAFMFLADLVRHLPQRIRVNVVTVSSYPGQSTASKGAALVGMLPGELTGRHVLVIDDILDSGQTLRLLRGEIERRGPRSLRCAVLLRKPIPAASDIPCEYVGFDIPDEFVVGYGLDYDGYYRNLPYIGSLKESAR